VLAHAERTLDQQHRRMVEHREIARVEDNAGRIAIAHSMRTSRRLLNMPIFSNGRAMARI
jgi:hypothetical protein